MLRLTQVAQDAQEQLDPLRDTHSQFRSDGQSPLDRDHPLRYQPPTLGRMTPASLRFPQNGNSTPVLYPSTLLSTPILLIALLNGRHVHQTRPQ